MRSCVYIVAKHVTGVLFLVQFNNFVRTIGVTCSYSSHRSYVLLVSIILRMDLLCKSRLLIQYESK